MRVSMGVAIDPDWPSHVDGLKYQLTHRPKLPSESIAWNPFAAVQTFLVHHPQLHRLLRDA